MDEQAALDGVVFGSGRVGVSHRARVVLARRSNRRRRTDEAAMRLIARCWILVTTLGIALAPRAAVAQGPTNQELLERIEGLEAQLAALKSLIGAKLAGAQAPNAEAPKNQAVKTEDTFSQDDLRGLKYGGSLDTYYEFNFNRPVGRVNL